MCNNTVGSFDCTCDDGYNGTGVDCDNIDECIDLPCDLNANCTDTEGI